MHSFVYISVLVLGDHVSDGKTILHRNLHRVSSSGLFPPALRQSLYLITLHPESSAQQQPLNI